jgi:hypothetical protein
MGLAFGRVRRFAIAVVALCLCGRICPAQTSPGWGRVSIFGQGILRPAGANGSRTSYGTYSGGLTLHSGSSEEAGFDYGLDFRAWQNAPSISYARVSLFEAFAGGRTRNGTFGLWAGQMWLTELGGLGSFGGVLVAASPRSAGTLGRFRFGLFGGVEPKILEVGYLPDIKKAGGFVALDGAHGLRSAVGYVLVKNGSIKERSAITMTNFIPIGTRFSLYQAGEYDLIKPGGLGRSGLNYIFVTARVEPVRWLELQATYHYGRSIDVRTITDDQINGRPVDPRLLDGFLFESLGGRLSFQILPTLRVYAGYAQEQGNKGDPTVDRATLGLYASNLFRSGFDLTVADNRFSRTGGNGNYDAWYASLGRSIGSRVYLSAEYADSLSIVRFTDSGGIVVETRPHTRRYGFQATANLSRWLSLLLTLEQLQDDDSSEQRGLLGLTFRF